MPILVLVSVIERDNRLLVCRRPLHKRHGGLWVRRDGEGIAYRPGEMSSAISGRRAPITSSKAGRLGTSGPSH